MHACKFKHCMCSGDVHMSVTYITYTHFSRSYKFLHVPFCTCPATFD